MISIKDAKYNYATYFGSVRPLDLLGKMKGLVYFVLSHKLITSTKQNPVSCAALQFRKISNMITIDTRGEYIYPWDQKIVRCLKKGFKPIASVTVDYSTILSSCLKDKVTDIEGMPDSEFKKSMQLCVEGIDVIRKKSIAALNANYARGERLISFLSRLYDTPCACFDEAIQRILFYNAILWQNRYMQNGIGRLDLILAPYYKKGIEDGTLTREQAKKMLQSMCDILGKDMILKSAGLIGDTGQVIILGGVDKDGNTIENDITHILLEIFTENPVPDPKLILRVNQNTSDAVWQKAVNCIIRGSGSPLILNEEQVIPLMEKFGYAQEDVYNFGTSACWEPLIIGKSLDQNNCIKNITILDALTSSLKNHANSTFDELIQNLDVEIAKRIADHDLTIEFDKAPILSLFFDDCIGQGIDFADGGAKYNHHGLLVVGLPNLVNSLLNIKKYVFDTKMCTIADCLECIDNNFANHSDLQHLFRSGALKFGSSSKEVVDLSNHIMEEVGKAVEKRRMFGEKIKVGFSSPSYIGLAKDYPASLDGRNQNDPFAVHISPVSSDIDISEILDFASQLKYDGCRINGNVVDFIVPASYAKHPEKLRDIVKDACRKGLFELQLNVLDKETLIDAKAHPENYPNLIVRVWGFSAYFNDLPEEYKDNLIKRAECYEA